MRCARCGRRVGIYLNELGRYVAHVIPLALHRAELCAHSRTRGIYGDEIWSTLRAWSGKLARVRCLDCGKALYDRARESADL